VPRTDDPTTVIDASALLALLQNEKGADEVAEAISGRTAISTVNLSEGLGEARRGRSACRHYRESD
jgi:PIN domain nuclease of toxin-antitoxin system